MIQVTPQMRVLVAIEPVDFRRGIDGLASVCRSVLRSDPFTGTIFVFRNRRSNAVKLLVYDGQGFWLCYKRMSRGKFCWWPTTPDKPVTAMQAHQLQVLLRAGNPQAAPGAEQWRSVTPE
jgi:transposase